MYFSSRMHTHTHAHPMLSLPDGDRSSCDTYPGVPDAGPHHSLHLARLRQHNTPLGTRQAQCFWRWPSKSQADHPGWPGDGGRRGETRMVSSVGWAVHFVKCVFIA